MRLLVPVAAPPLHIFSPDEAAGAKGTTMALSANYKAFLEDLFSEFGPVEVRSMFGGAGIFADGVMLGLAADGALYLKADEIFAGEFAAEGKGPFTYQAKGRKPVSMSYWEVAGAPLGRSRRIRRLGAARPLGGARREKAEKCAKAAHRETSPESKLGVVAASVKAALC
jgi:DNA transformation protein